jgi:hypothetical protein
LYEDADIRELGNKDLIAISQMPFRNHEDYFEGEHYIKVVENCIQSIRDGYNIRRWMHG